MSVPGFQSLLRPMLELAAKAQDVSMADAIPALANSFQLSDDDLAERIPSGRQGLFVNRANWAKTYLKKAGCLTYPGRSRFAITSRGRQLLDSHVGPISVKTLKQFESFQNFHSYSPPENGTEPNSKHNDDVEATPEEQISEAIEVINSELADELLERIQKNSPAFFERLLVSLLISMGYGGSAEEAGRDLGQSGDGGVDGVIDQDALGVEQIYIQAKRYAETNPVGPGAIRDFFGALNIKRATKGIFFTTSSFTHSARQTADALGSRIVLIEGRQLARLMIRYEVGCRTDSMVTIRKVDEDFFDET